MVHHGWKLGAAGGALAAAGFLLFEDPLVIEAIWRLTLIGACIGVVLGVRWHRHARTYPWWLLFVALAILAVANLATYPAWNTALATTVADVMSIMAFPLFGLAALAMARLQAPGGDRESAIDGAIVMVAMATVLAGTVYSEAHLPGDVGLAARLLNTVVAPLVMAAVAAATFRLLFVGSVRIPSAWFVVGAATAGMTGNTLRALATAQGVYERGLWSDVFILASYVAIGLAILHPSSTAITREAPARFRRFTTARLAVLGLCLLASPTTLAIRGEGGAWSLPVVSSAVLSALVLWRLSRLVVEREAARRDLHLQAERQEALAELGMRALEEDDLGRLSDDAARRCTDLVGLRSCAVMLDADAPDAELHAPHRAGGALLAIPLHGGRVLVAERDHAWSSEDLAFLRSVANVLTGAFERHETHEEMRRRASHDGLTGLPNREHLLEHLAQAEARRRRDGSELTVMFLDLDGFKRVNDEHGHRIGDELLVTVARRLTDCVRAHDTVGRLAGDEFVIIGEASGEEEAMQVADRIVDVLSQPFALDGGELDVGVSVGIVTADGDCDDPERLLARADQAMYLAKGRSGSAVAVGDRCSQAVEAPA